MGVWHWQSDKTCTSSYNEPGYWSSEVFSFPLKQRNLSLLVWQILLKLKYSAASIKAVTESTDKCRQTLLLWQGKEWSCWFSYPDTPCERKHQTQSWSVLLKGMAKLICLHDMCPFPKDYLWHYGVRDQSETGDMWMGKQQTWSNILLNSGSMIKIFPARWLQ